MGKMHDKAVIDLQNATTKLNNAELKLTDASKKITSTKKEMEEYKKYIDFKISLKNATLDKYAIDAKKLIEEQKKNQEITDKLGDSINRLYKKIPLYNK